MDLDERALKTYTSSKPSKQEQNIYARGFMNIEKEFLTPKELSEMLNLSISKLAYDRMRNVGVPFVKFSEGHRHLVRYPRFKGREFINKNMKAEI